MTRALARDPGGPVPQRGRLSEAFGRAATPSGRPSPRHSWSRASCAAPGRALVGGAGLLPSRGSWRAPVAIARHPGPVAPEAEVIAVAPVPHFRRQARGDGRGHGGPPGSGSGRRRRGADRRSAHGPEPLAPVGRRGADLSAALKVGREVGAGSVLTGASWRRASRVRLDAELRSVAGQAAGARTSRRPGGQPAGSGGRPGPRPAPGRVALPRAAAEHPPRLAHHQVRSRPSAPFSRESGSIGSRAGTRPKSPSPGRSRPTPALPSRTCGWPRSWVARGRWGRTTCRVRRWRRSVTPTASPSGTARCFGIPLFAEEDPAGQSTPPGPTCASIPTTSRRGFCWERSCSIQPAFALPPDSVARRLRSGAPTRLVAHPRPHPPCRAGLDLPRQRRLRPLPRRHGSSHRRGGPRRSGRASRRLGTARRRPRQPDPDSDLSCRRATRSAPGRMSGSQDSATLVRARTVCSRCRSRASGWAPQATRYASLRCRRTPWRPRGWAELRRAVACRTRSSDTTSGWGDHGDLTDPDRRHPSGTGRGLETRMRPITTGRSRAWSARSWH